MKTPRRAVEFEVEEFKIEEKGFTEGPYIARFELLWPRPGIEDVKSVIPIPVDPGQAVDWTDEPLKSKYLFKEDIEGRFVLTVSVLPLVDEESDFEADNEVNDLVGRLIHQQSSLTLSTISDLVELGGAAAGYVLSGPQKTIARGDVTVNEQASQSLKVDLEAPVELSNPRPDPDPGSHDPEDEHRDILKEPGDPNGYVTVKMSVWDE
jgi:hypothetical protein